MKKLIAIILAVAVMFCGCSLFGLGEESGGLSEKLSELGSAEQRETDMGAGTAPEAQLLPDRLAFEQIDPYDMLHNGWSLTQTKARDEYGMEPYEDIDDYMHIDGLAQLLPGTDYGSAAGMWNYTSNGMQVGAVGEYEYQYRFDHAMSNEDAAQVFRLAVAAADEQFGGRNKSWDNEKFNHFESLGNLEFAGLLFNDEDNHTSDATGCSWGFYADGNPGIFTIILRAYEERIDELIVYIDFGTGRTQKSSYFPDDAAGGAAPGSSSPGEPAVPAKAQAPASVNAIGGVYIGTYSNDDVFGAGLVWRITFHADHTFEFSYDHEEGTEHFTGNWSSEKGYRVTLNVTSGAPFTTYLYGDGVGNANDTLTFDDEGFSNVSLYFAG